MEQTIDIEQELQRIEALPLDERAHALEDLERTLRAELEDEGAEQA